ncbi:hypothetical protein AB1K84_09365 [Mesobacillus foraminis]|uniref:hypothetical protein n=1 Tax=Mesobacillus foraminis TaxID=279826 RepID=UPI00399FCA54
MDFLSINHWDPVLWNLVDELNQEAFGKNGAQLVSIIQNMFEKQLCVLHLMVESNEDVAMSLTGAIPNKGILIIDYLAVNKDRRLKQYGWNMDDYIKKWAMPRREYSLILLEAEQFLSSCRNGGILL